MIDVNSVKQRIKQARISLGYTQKQVAKMQCMQQYNISRQEIGNVYPSLEYLNFLEQEGVNLNWIFSGKGDAFLNKTKIKHIELIY